MVEVPYIMGGDGPAVGDAVNWTDYSVKGQGFFPVRFLAEGVEPYGPDPSVQATYKEIVTRFDATNNYAARFYCLHEEHFAEKQAGAQLVAMHQAISCTHQPSKADHDQHAHLLKRQEDLRRHGAGSEHALCTITGRARRGQGRQSVWLVGRW